MDGRADNTTADAIRRVALESFARQGYHASALREIARRCDITLGTVYHYYPSKEGLLFELMQEAMTPLLESLERVRAERDPAPASQLFWAVWSFVEFAATHRRLTVLADVELRALGEANYATVVGWRDSYQARIRDIVDRGVDAGVFEAVDSKIAVFSILAIANQVARWYEPGGELSVVEVSSRVATLAMQMLGYDASELSSRAAVEGVADEGAPRVSSAGA